jgi:AcrR family transcriptional regulator
MDTQPFLEDSNTGRRRQARGEKRMEALLAAAEKLFVQYGYERVTTNLIAAEAGASPGTLYQFFTNKEAMANALAGRYVAELEMVHAAVVRESKSTSINEFIDAVVDPFLEFHIRAPAFRVLLMGNVETGLVEQWKILRRSATDLVVRLLEPMLGGRSRTDLTRISQVVLGVFRGILPLIESAGDGRSQIIAEMKLLFRRYLGPMISSD